MAKGKKEKADKPPRVAPKRAQRKIDRAKRKGADQPMNYGTYQELMDAKKLQARKEDAASKQE